MTNKGDTTAWFVGTVISLITALSVLFADELFRFRMSFRISYTEAIGPSDPELTGRYISWSLVPVISAVILALGLR